MALVATAHADTFARDHLPPREAWPELSHDISYPERVNAAQALLDPRFAAHPAVHGAEATWTYAELRDRAERVARVLADEAGLVPGNRVLLHGANTPELVAAWLGILLAGGVVVATMPLLRAGELGKVIAKAEVSHAIVDGRVAGPVAEARAAHPVLQTVMAFGPEGDLDARLAAAAPGFAAVATAADDVAIIAFTSGTTGEPKGCVHLHRDLLATCDTFAARVLGVTPDDVFTSTPPLAFTFGLGVLVLFPLRFGASLIPIERPSPAAVVEAVTRHGATTLSTAPTMYRTLLRDGTAAALTTLRACVSAGEPLPAAVAERWAETTGVRIVDGIGSTEMLHIFIAAPAAAVRFGSVGTPVPGYEARVVDADMRSVGTNAIGRLAVRGPTGCRYLDDPRQADYVVDGWNVTGDSFTVDEDGYFWFAARNDDLIVSSGYNISPLEVEGALLEHAAVAECAVVGSPDEQRGHVVKAYVVPADGVTGDDALTTKLQDHVKARIAPYKYPRRIEFLDALPRTATGKVRRGELRAREA